MEPRSLTKRDVREFLNSLNLAGWTIKERTVGALKLGQLFRERFPRLPDEYASFLACTALCVNPTETAWFLCEDDYNGLTDSMFKWNEFENQSLEAADQDDLVAASVKRFWNNHLPIIMSVNGSYAYFAISLVEDSLGEIVFGSEPEYEETVKVCDSFSELIDLICHAVTTGVGSGTIKSII